MKYRTRSYVYKSDNHLYEQPEWKYILGSVDTPHGVVTVYSASGNRLSGPFTTCSIIINRRTYHAWVERKMKIAAIIRFAHKFARDVVAGRVK